MKYRFHINLFAMPESVLLGGTIPLRGVQVRPLRTPAGKPLTFDNYLPVSFEQALASLTQLPRLDAEPDGFFVVAGGHGDDRWQLDGHLFDFGGNLHRVELHGHCPADAFDGIIRCLGWPDVSLAFELVLEGIALDEADFRAWAVA